MVYHNLLIVAGNGNKAGKTTLACRVICKFASAGITALKITHHFHEITPGLEIICEGEGYSVFAEHDNNSQKDTSRMLRAGASKVYFAKVTDTTVETAFKKIIDLIPENTPVVCESPSLRYFAEPGVFIIMESENSLNKKDISKLQSYPHVRMSLGQLEISADLPLNFENGRWVASG